MKNIFISCRYHVLIVLFALSNLYFGAAQELRIPSSGELPEGAYIKGLYHLQADDPAGQYIKESDGILSYDTFNTAASKFYFWGIENAFKGTFQLYSARIGSEGKPLSITNDGTTRFATTVDEDRSHLLLQMYPEGPMNDSNNPKASKAIIVTESLTEYSDTNCKCNVLQIEGNSKFKIIRSENDSFNEYRPIVFEKASINNTGIISEINDQTIITQPETQHFQNFVSTNFYVKNFAEDDFKVNITPGTQGTIGFLHYTHHHYTKNVFANAKPQIGIKIIDDKISLFYLSGNQPLPFSQEGIGHEILTDFVFGQDITFGFSGQDVFVASQGDKVFELKGAVPTEFFFNQSITRTARAIARLKKGEITIASTPKNFLIGSANDKGDNDGSNFISTNAYLPYNQGKAFVNTFNWQQTQWDVRYIGDNGLVEERVFSPFYSNEIDFAGISAKYSPNGSYLGGEDFSAVEGWELIKSNLGYNADGTKRNQASVYPYAILYDRISGTLRVFMYTKNESIANQLTISLKMDRGLPGNQSNDPSYTPKLWGGLQQFEALNNSESSAYSRSLPYLASPGRSWYFADFVMEYDPCIDFFESSIKINVTKTTQGDLTMIGRLEGGAIPAGTQEYDDWQNNKDKFLLGAMDNDFGELENTLGDVTFNQYENFNAKEFTEEITGTLEGKEIQAWEKEAARLEWEGKNQIANAEIADGSFKIAEGVAKIAEGAAKMNSNPLKFLGFKIGEGGAKIAQGAAKIGQGGATVAKGNSRKKVAYARKLYYDNIKDKTKRSDQNIKLSIPPPRPQAVFGEIALKGTLSIETTLINAEFIATPGAKNSDNTPEWYNNGTRGAAPLYNKDMGKFSLLKSPKFGIKIIHDKSFGYSAYLKTKEKPYIVHNAQALGKLDDIFKIAVHVETFNRTGKRISGFTSNGYTNFFGNDINNPLPGNMDITSLIDWEQIQKNIRANGDINTELSSWIRVSYEIWSLTLSNIKSRDLARVFANGDNYYRGESEFHYSKEEAASLYHFENRAKQLANAQFNEYTFVDNSDWGLQYNLYNTQSDFEDLMLQYCASLNSNAKRSNPAPEDLPETIPLLKTQEDLSVYPNPSKLVTNFNLNTHEQGKVLISLLDMSGKELLKTDDFLNGRDLLTGTISIQALIPGIYILKVILPSGKRITRKIIKN
ncbi:T9SS C-terminal target domain-containing protein [Aquimarina sp. AD10]|uniref:T9SS type A sorting domain-containing protein n=1 Tax=Aquimarina sp. AD10 TaxID=1714849 RepID=UPI000E4FF714|nr:T9SS type A sorting domain-containing protein [Aquimarina sp. AD10]AXT63376.1 T9SS C-terminal target domain-containing protein [Aquimarina sp. AD10]RKN00611.1 T9SS C-terminal target domain-containing protein [Aquimarina sp. AD10]